MAVKRRAFLQALGLVATAPTALIARTYFDMAPATSKNWDPVLIEPFGRQEYLNPRTSVYVSDFGMHRVINPALAVDSGKVGIDDIDMRPGAINEAKLKAMIQECWDNGGNPDTIWVSDSQFEVLSGFTG